MDRMSQLHNDFMFHMSKAVEIQKQINALAAIQTQHWHQRNEHHEKLAELQKAE